MKALSHLFDNNKKWSAGIHASSPGFFAKLAAQQEPQYLYIGCSDSRVPANEVVGLLPGELFVHRNVANLVIHTDMNCLSVLQFAVDFLKVKHVLVVGHYGCGGVEAAMATQPHGLVDNWLRHIRDIYQKHHKELAAIRTKPQRLRRLCEWNVIEQVINVGNTTIIHDAWKRGQPVAIHGWMFDIADGLLRDLKASITSAKELKTLQDQS